LEDVLEISAETGIPLVYDNLHNKLNPCFLGADSRKITGMVKKTWGEGWQGKSSFFRQATFEK